MPLAGFSFFLTLSAAAAFHDLATALQTDNFQKCPLGYVWTSQELHTAHSRSTMDCVAMCARTVDCEAVNVCPDDNQSGDGMCHLLYDANDACCNGLVTSSFPECRYVMPRPLDCKNGGKWDGARCLCTIEFSGETCERYIRDCTESFANGHQNTNESGPYNIQPILAPSPFLVYCEFNWGGVTRFMIRRMADSVSFNVNWNTAKTGFGDPASTSFFVGLENLHYLTTQLSYVLHIWFNLNGGGGASAKFQNFTIGPESSSYALSYTSFFVEDPVNPSDDGFMATSPLLFSTQDNDHYGCAAAKGYPGWFSPACTGYSLFADQIDWPVNGLVRSAYKYTAKLENWG